MFYSGRYLRAKSICAMSFLRPARCMADFLSWDLIRAGSTRVCSHCELSQLIISRGANRGSWLGWENLFQGHTS